MRPVRVLLVDDSPTMRALLRHALVKDDRIQVVGEAGDPMEARQKIKDLDPDVVTLDIEMPGMNGLEFLEKIMRLRPTPVIMVSTLTQPGAAATLQALELGAFDCIAKPSTGASDTLSRLPELVCAAARAKPVIAARGMTARPSTRCVPEAHPEWPDLVTIGSSTGGVEVLIQLLSDWPADGPPTMIVQHLPASFTGSFAARLDRASKAHVAEAKDGDPVRPGHVYLAPGNHHLKLKNRAGKLSCQLNGEPTVQGHRPSVDVLFHSVAEGFEGKVTSVILTGMGRDGAEGMLAMRQKGFRTLAQDEATSLVYGMPRVAHEIGAAQKRVPLGRIVREVFA